eukprot:g32746.t1
MAEGTGYCKGMGLRTILTMVLKICAPELAAPLAKLIQYSYNTVKCHPYYLLQQFTSTTLIAVSILPHVCVKNALDEICTATNTLEMKFPEALFIMAGDFKQANLKQMLQRSKADTISLALHSSLKYLDNKDTYIRLLLIDYSSAFNTIIPSRL